MMDSIISLYHWNDMGLALTAIMASLLLAMALIVVNMNVVVLLVVLQKFGTGAYARWHNQYHLFMKNSLDAFSKVTASFSS